MTSCDAWGALIVRAADGTIDADESARLTAHLEICDRCRQEGRSQAELQRLLATRVEEPVPAEFAARLVEALNVEASSSWIDVVNWRAWGLRLGSRQF